MNGFTVTGVFLYDAGGDEELTVARIDETGDVEMFPEQ